MLLKISSTAIGSNNLTPIPPDQQLINNDFLITSNNSRLNRATGDGEDELTEWNFDFKLDPNWLFFILNKSIKSAIMTLTISPKHPDIATDRLKINYSNLSDIRVLEIQQAEVGQTKTIEFDLLNNGYTSENILRVLRDNDSIIPMHYQDDAIISFAKLEIFQNIEPVQNKKLHIEAISEDTIASPGNRKPNYILVSVTDSNGKAISNLNKRNFNVDPLIVGPGGSLVNIVSARQSSRIEGFYILQLKPIRQETWKPGVYVFAIAVESNNNRGQTLASVLMD